MQELLRYHQNLEATVGLHGDSTRLDRHNTLDYRATQGVNRKIQELICTIRNLDEQIVRRSETRNSAAAGESRYKYTNGWTRLHYAAKEANMEKLVRMLQKPYAKNFNINAENSQGWTPLYWAAFNGLPEIVSKLIEAGADVNFQNPNRTSKTALLLAARMRFVHTELFPTDSPNSRRLHYDSPEWKIRSKDYVETVRILLEAGADMEFNPSGSDRWGDPNFYKLVKRNHEWLGEFVKPGIGYIISAEPLKEECAICKELNVSECEANHEAKLENCGHIFHKGCIDIWLFTMNNHSCPMCRASVKVVGVEELSEQLRVNRREQEHAANPQNYILNPSTGRYVRRDGRFGRNLVIQQELGNDLSELLNDDDDELLMDDDDSN